MAQESVLRKTMPVKVSKGWAVSQEQDQRTLATPDPTPAPGCRMRVELSPGRAENALVYGVVQGVPQDNHVYTPN